MIAVQYRTKPTNEKPSQPAATQRKLKKKIAVLYIISSLLMQNTVVLHRLFTVEWRVEHAGDRACFKLNIQKQPTTDKARCHHQETIAGGGESSFKSENRQLSNETVLDFSPDQG